MKPVPRRFAALALAALAAGTMPACASSGGSAPSRGAGKPVSGGILKFAASSDFDHVDTLSAYYVPSFGP